MEKVVPECCLTCRYEFKCKAKAVLQLIMCLNVQFMICLMHAAYVYVV